MLYINHLPDNVNSNITIYADNTTLYSKCDQASDRVCGNNLNWLLFESDLHGTVDWGKWLVDLNAGKTQLVLFDQFKNNGSIDVKMDVCS